MSAERSITLNDSVVNNGIMIFQRYAIMNKVSFPVSNTVYSNIFAIGIITASLAPSPAWTQATTEFSAYCMQNITDERRTVVTDRFTVTGPTGDEFNVRQSITQSITQKFRETVGNLGDVGCIIKENAAELERDRIFIIGYAGKTAAVEELKGWHPNKPDAAKLRGKTGALPSTKIQTSAPSGKRDSLIVRSPDEAPVKPAAKPTSAPVAKAKPAAKPVPKKPLKPCSRKGSCAKPM